MLIKSDTYIYRSTYIVLGRKTRDFIKWCKLRCLVEGVVFPDFDIEMSKLRKVQDLTSGRI